MNVAANHTIRNTVGASIEQIFPLHLKGGEGEGEGVHTPSPISYQLKSKHS